jgi:hypothetical protein
MNGSRSDRANSGRLDSRYGDPQAGGAVGGEPAWIRPVRKYVAATFGAGLLLALSIGLAIAWGAAFAHVTTEGVVVGATSAEANETRSSETPYAMDRAHAELVTALAGRVAEVGGQPSVASVVAPARERNQPIVTCQVNSPTNVQRIPHGWRR